MTTDEAILSFARQLGWTRLKRKVHVVPATGDEPRFTGIWYECGSIDDICLLIDRSYSAVVYAMSFRIYSNRHSFVPYRSPARLAKEVSRLELWLHRRWFKEAKSRREYRQMHPECANWSWKRLEQTPLAMRRVSAMTE